MISDDEYFTEYLVEDLDNIFSGKSLFTPSDWKKLEMDLNLHTIIRML